MKTILAILSIMIAAAIGNAAERTYARFIDIDGSYFIDIDGSYLVTLTKEAGTFTVGAGGSDFADTAAYETAGETPGDILVYEDIPATSLEISTLTTGTEAEPISLDFSGLTIDVPWLITGGTGYLGVTARTITAPGYLGGAHTTLTGAKAQ